MGVRELGIATSQNHQTLDSRAKLALKKCRKKLTEASDTQQDRT